MNRQEEVLCKCAILRKQIFDMLSRQGYASSDKSILLLAYFDVILEHHESISVLIQKKLFGSGFALLRPLVESFFRALWVNARATSKQLKQIQTDDDFEFPKTMLKEIDVAYATEGFFQKAKRDSWKSMCSYTHSGSLQLTRRFDKRGDLYPNYSEEEIIQTLHVANSTLILAAVFFFKAVGQPAEAHEAEKLGLKY